MCKWRMYAERKDFFETQDCPFAWWSKSTQLFLLRCSLFLAQINIFTLFFNSYNLFLYQYIIFLIIILITSNDFLNNIIIIKVLCRIITKYLDYLNDFSLYSNIKISIFYFIQRNRNFYYFQRKSYQLILINVSEI